MFVYYDLEKAEEIMMIRKVTITNVKEKYSKYREREREREKKNLILSMNINNGMKKY